MLYLCEKRIISGGSSKLLPEQQELCWSGEREEHELFTLQVDLRKEYVTAPLLFDIFIDVVMGKSQCFTDVSVLLSY